MTRLLASLVALVVLAGCSGSGGTPLDPFSRTRIEPPRTGSIWGRPSTDPYYSGIGQATLPDSAAPRAVRSTVNPKAGNLYEPPGGYDFQGSSAPQPDRPLAARPGDRIAIPVAARREPERLVSVAGSRGSQMWAELASRGRSEPARAATASDAAVTAESPSEASDPARWQGAPGRQISGPQEPQQVVRTILPRPNRAGSTSPHTLPRAPRSPAGRQPRRLAAPRRAVDIMDLPPARSNGRTGSAASPSGIRLVSATAELDGPPADARSDGDRSSGAASASGASPFSTRARYGYDPEYRCLRGRLEYSQVDRRWKLRYIPIDGDTDRFGGSVVLSNPSVLDGYQPGEFVEVQGTLGAQVQDDYGFAPPFEVRGMQPLGS